MKTPIVKRQPIAVIGTDSHLKKDNEELVINCFKQVRALMLSLQVNTFCHGGDFFTTRNAQPEASLRAAKKIFNLFIDEEEDLDYYQIPGNHDKTELDSENSYLDIFDKYCNLIKGYNHLDLKGVRIHFIPYFKEDGSYKDYLKKATENLDKTRKNVLLTHIAVTGVKNNDGSEVENSLTSKLFAKFDSVLVGHYHNRSQIGSNIHYIGSMFASNYGEDNNKGVTILFNDGTHEHYQLDFPHYIKVQVDANEKKSLKEIQKEYKDTNHHVRLILKGEKSDLETIDKTELQELGFDVKFEDNSIMIDSDISQGELLVFNRSNLKDAFDEFCKNSNIEDSEFGSKYLELI